MHATRTFSTHSLISSQVLRLDKPMQLSRGPQGARLGSGRRAVRIDGCMFSEERRSLSPIDILSPEALCRGGCRVRR